MPVSSKGFVVLAALLAVGCGSSRSSNDAYIPAQTNITSSGLDTCTPQASESASQVKAAQDAQLTAAQSIRLCLLANTVRHEQWSAGHASDTATRDKINGVVAREIDRAIPSVTNDQKATPILRAYLLGKGS